MDVDSGDFFAPSETDAGGLRAVGTHSGGERDYSPHVDSADSRAVYHTLAKPVVAGMYTY